LEAETISISGSGKIEGGVKAQSLKISGSGKVEGPADVQDLHISGSGKIAGDARTKIFHTSGSSKVEGSAWAQEFQISGSGRVEKDLHAKEVRISGSAKIGGGVEADRFFASGAFEIGGLLSADEIKISLYGLSRAGEIGGADIEVRKREGSFWFLRWLWGGHDPRLETETIEGDEIYLEHTRADVVRGKRIKLGPGCQIGTVEYSESLQIDPSSAVKEQVQVL
jgi:cytoskeletal protein CcmA (bactofilin family)